MNTNSMPLSLYGETFHALKGDFDTIINRTIGNMEMKGSDEATVTIKVKVKLEKTTGFNGLREMVAPTFNHEVTSVMQVKDKETGKTDGGYELVWDDKKKQYVMRKIDDGQISMDDYEDLSEDTKEPAQLTAAPAQFAAPKEEKKGDGFFRWLCNFIDVDLTVHEANGIFTLRDDENCVILSSGTDPSSRAYLSAEVLSPHVGHEIYILDGGESLDVICDTCGKKLVSIYEEDGTEDEEPNEEDGSEDYEYDDPDDIKEEGEE